MYFPAGRPLSLDVGREARATWTGVALEPDARLDVVHEHVADAIVVELSDAKVPSWRPDFTVIGEDRDVRGREALKPLARHRVVEEQVEQVVVV